MPLGINIGTDFFNEEYRIQNPKINLQNKVSHQENCSAILLS